MRHEPAACRDAAGPGGAESQGVEDRLVMLASERTHRGCCCVRRRRIARSGDRSIEAEEALAVIDLSGHLIAPCVSAAYRAAPGWFVSHYDSQLPALR